MNENKLIEALTSTEQTERTRAVVWLAGLAHEKYPAKKNADDSVIIHQLCVCFGWDVFQDNAFRRLTKYTVSMFVNDVRRTWQLMIEGTYHE